MRQLLSTSGANQEQMDREINPPTSKSSGATAAQNPSVLMCASAEEGVEGESREGVVLWL